MGHVRPEMGPPQPGAAAPDFELPRVDGSKFRLSSALGSWVVLHFTASWCPFCDSEIEYLGKLADDYAPRGVKVVLVDLKEPASVWEPYAKAHVAPSVVAVHDLSGEVGKSYAPPRAQPSFKDRAQVLFDCTLLVDPKGVIRLFLMPDSAHFDPTFAAVKRELERMMGGPTRVAATPAEHGPVEAILPPERVVEVRTTATGDQAVIALRIAPGYHIMSNRPSKPNYVATRVELDPSEGLSFGEPVYATSSSFVLGGESIAVFEGDVEFRVPVRAASPTQGRKLTGSLKYQACTTSRCLFPVTKTLSFELPAAN
jgi:peroxiredoxin